MLKLDRDYKEIKVEKDMSQTIFEDHVKELTATKNRLLGEKYELEKKYNELVEFQRQKNKSNEEYIISLLYKKKELIEEYEQKLIEKENELKLNIVTQGGDVAYKCQELIERNHQLEKQTREAVQQALFDKTEFERQMKVKNTELKQLELEKNEKEKNAQEEIKKLLTTNIHNETLMAGNKYIYLL